jgi:putative transposase
MENLFGYLVSLGLSIFIYWRSDNGPEFTARAIWQWLRDLGVKTLYIELESSWENGYIESFNGKLRNELLNMEIFNTLFEAQVLIEYWRKEYNQTRPLRALGYRPPAPEAIMLGFGSTSLTLSVVQWLGGGRGEFFKVIEGWSWPKMGNY